MTLRVRQIIKINSISVCYNGKGDDGQNGFLHFFTLDMPGKETQVLDKVMDRYTKFGQEVSKAKHEAVIAS